MEHELEGSGVPPSSKQAFIYKKNPASTAKAITRKMRPSHAPQQLEPQNSTGGESAYRTGGKSRFEAGRSSQNEAETIATQGQRSGVSPSSKAQSQTHFNNMDSTGVLGSTKGPGPGENRKFHKGMGGSTGKKNSYYEDNIDSETEVFIDPHFENKLGSKGLQQARRTEMARQRKPAARELFPNMSGDEPNNYLHKKPHRRSQQGAPLSQADHFKAIDAVINSNVDDRTKQHLIADIQEKYRLSQRAAEAGKTSKPRTQKQYIKDHPEDSAGNQDTNEQRTQPRKSRKHANEPQFGANEYQEQIPQQQDGGFDPQQQQARGKYYPDQQKGRTAKPLNRQIRQKNKQPDDQREHQNFLMPEMNEFIDGGKKRNYLTQDEMGDSKMGKPRDQNRRRKQNRAESEDNEDLSAGKLKHFTPGRIRASRMGQQSDYPDKDKQQTPLNGRDDFLNQTQGKPRANTKQPKYPRVQQVDRDDSLQSIEDTDYNQILPAVKLRQRRKKNRSPSPNLSPGENSSQAGLRDRNQSVSRISAAGKDPKLRATLDQNLHWKPTSVKVPIKQTHFYDDKHDSGITAQQLQTWKVKNGAVMMDDFHTGKAKVPANRHRIPTIGEEKIVVGSGAPKKLPGRSPDGYLWDMDGRKHKKAKQPKPQRAITQNASHRKVDLPRINSTRPNLMSPNSQPTILGRLPAPPGKFLGPNDKRLKNVIPPPTDGHLSSGPLDLIDIGIIRPNIDPPTNDLPDYDCPVCLIRVKGRDTAPHSRNCRTQACRFCYTEQPLVDLDRHEQTCNKDQGPIRCRFCRFEFPAQDILDHETTICKEPGRCRFCKYVYPVRELQLHEQTCNELESCKGCRNGFPPQDINRHEAGCPWPGRCRFCKHQYPIQEIDRHEGKCDVPSQCRGCKREFPRRDFFDIHVGECPEPAPCDFCGTEFLPRDIDKHEDGCNEPINCTICFEKFPRLEIPQHESQCDGTKPLVDPKPYLDHVERQRKKLQNKSKGDVFVEDDYVKPEDFRDPGGRKNRDKSNDSGVPKPLKSRGSENKPSRSLGRKSSKSPIRPDDKSIDRSNNSQGPGSTIQQPQTEVTVTAKGRAQSPFTNPNQSQVFPRSNTEGTVQDLQEDRTPKGILKEGNKESLTPVRLNSTKDAFSGEYGSKIPSGQATGSSQIREINSGEPGLRPKLNQDHSRTNNFRSEDRVRNQNQPINTKSGISIGSRERLPPYTAVDGDLNDSMEKGSGPGRYDEHSQEVRDRDYQQKMGKHVHSSNDVTSSQRRANGQKQNSEYAGADVKLNKIKSQTAASQVRFAYGTGESLAGVKQIVSDKNAKVTSSQVLQSGKQVQEDDSRHRQAYSSVEAGLQNQTSKKKKKASPDGKSTRSINKSHTTELKSRKSSKKLGAMYFPDEKSAGRSATSKSPEARRVIGMLTHHRVKIDKETKLLINGSEILTQEGIKGTIHKVGVGFGTGRWTSGRRLDLLKEVPVHVPVHRPQPMAEPAKEQMASLESPKHREPIRMDAETQHIEPEVHSEGCDPIPRSVRSQKISAHVSQHDLGLSARTATVVPDKLSIGVSAKLLSEISVREQGDQITEGRFEPVMVDTQVNTDRGLLDLYLRKPKTDSGMNTAPVIFGNEKPITHSAFMQTEPQVNEHGTPDEPMVVLHAHEPKTAQVNLETGSNSSLIDIPVCDEVLELVLPPEPEPTTEDDPYVDDWADSQLYKYAYELHYDHMVKKRLIIETLVQRPATAKSQDGMNNGQKFEHNLNPEGLSILSYMECDYGQSALRHKSAFYRNQENLLDLYNRAKTTISVLNANMVRPDVCDRVLFNHYSEVTSKNVIKLLLRVNRLYDARNESVNILKLVMEVEAVIYPKSDLWSIMSDNSRNQLKKPFHDMLLRNLKILSNALTSLAIFRQEHRLFKNEFKFNKKEYRDYLHGIGKIIGGFLRLKNEPNPALQETGHLQEEHTEHSEQTERYEEWAGQSLKDYGRLEMPNEADIEQTLQSQQPQKKLKGSRIDRALTKHREEQREKSELASSAFELTSKSKILHQMQIKAVQLDLQKQSHSYQSQVNADWQKTSISDQMIDRLQQSAHKREGVAKAQEKQRLREETGYQSPTETEEENPKVKVSTKNEPMKLEDLLGAHQQPSLMSDSVGDYEQINIGRYNFANSEIGEKDEKRTPNISINDQETRQNVSIPKLMNLPVGQHHERNQSSQQVKSASASVLNTDRVTPTQNQKTQIANNFDYGNQSEIGNLEVRSITTPSAQTIVPHAPPSNLPITFGRANKQLEESDSLMQLNRHSQQSDIDEQTEFTEQMENESQRIAHETDKSIENIQRGIEDDEGDKETINSGRRTTYGDARSQLKILNQGQIKIKYQPSSPSRQTQSQMNSRNAESNFNDRQ